MNDYIIVIPARLASTRLPRKPLVDIGGKTMIEHVYNAALVADVGEVVVASAEEELHQRAIDLGINSILVDDDLPSGSDRVFGALKKLGKKSKFVINLQGDVPTIKPTTIRQVARRIAEGDVDIATLANEIHDDYQKADPNTVKVVVSSKSKALYFTRSANVPHGQGPLYHHIGVYAYKFESLAQFVLLPPSPLELREKLEQLRALENEMTIGIAMTEDNPHGVDTADDLLIIRKIMGIGNLTIKK